MPVALVGKTNKISTSFEVVRESLKALERGDSVAVIGDFNTHAITKLSPLVPRKILLSMLEKRFRK
jgi:short-subunit dehydrogenase